MGSGDVTLIAGGGEAHSCSETSRVGLISTGRSLNSVTLRGLETLAPHDRMGAKVYVFRSLSTKRHSFVPRALDLENNNQDHWRRWDEKRTCSISVFTRPCYEGDPLKNHFTLQSLIRRGNQLWPGTARRGVIPRQSP